MSVNVKKSGKGPKEPYIWLEIHESLQTTTEPTNNFVRIIGNYEYKKAVHFLTNRLENGEKIEAVPLDLSMINKYPPTECAIEVFGALYLKPQVYVRVFFYTDLGHDVDLQLDYLNCMRKQRELVRCRKCM